MKKRFDVSDDKIFKQLDENIDFNDERKVQLQRAVFDDLNQLQSRKKYKHILMYASSIVAFLLMIFIGINFVFDFDNENGLGNEQEQEQEQEQEKESVDEKITDVETDIVDVQPQKYYGTYDEEDRYEIIGMTDTYANFLIPVMMKDVEKDMVANISFSASDRLINHLNELLGIRPAWGNLPLHDLQLDGNHLHLYFSEEDLLNIRGSTGTSLGTYSMRTFATNYSDAVEYYTGYGDGVPFDHFGEDFDLINSEVSRQMTLLPVNTGKGIFLRQHYEQFENLEQLLQAFFNIDERLNADYQLDLRMFSFERYDEEQNQITIYLNGDLLNEGQNLDQENLKLLIAQGIGANLRHNQQFFDQPIEKAKIILEGETIFDGSLSSIRYNVVDINSSELLEKKINASLKEELLTKAKTALSALDDEHWSELSNLVSPSKGLLFSHYAYVEPETNLIFTKRDVAEFEENNQLYIFGYHHMKDDQIYEFTPKDYIENILMNFEYFNLDNTKINYSEILFNDSQTPGGGIINNIEEVYPNGLFVEYYAPYPNDERFTLWQGLRFVFEQENHEWYLVAIVRDIHSP